jgi:hypothetical protein
MFPGVALKKGELALALGQGPGVRTLGKQVRILPGAPFPLEAIRGRAGLFAPLPHKISPRESGFPNPFCRTRKTVDGVKNYACRLERKFICFGYEKTASR